MKKFCGWVSFKYEKAFYSGKLMLWFIIVAGVATVATCMFFARASLASTATFMVYYFLPLYMLAAVAMVVLHVLVTFSLKKYQPLCLGYQEKKKRIYKVRLPDFGLVM